MDNADLMVSAKFIGRQCADENIAFVRCKAKTPNPGACTAEGERVTRCVFAVYVAARGGARRGAARGACGDRRADLTGADRRHSSLHEHCPDAYDAYKQCMFWNNNRFGKCRKLQKALDECWAERETAADEQE